MVRIHLTDVDGQHITTQDRFTVPKEGDIIRLTLNGQPERFQVVETQHNWDILPSEGVVRPYGNGSYDEAPEPENFVVIARQLEQEMERVRGEIDTLQPAVSAEDGSIPL